MKTVYVLMYRSNEEFIVDAAKRETAFGKPKPYAVFENSITAEKMKRDGDEIIEVPFFEDPTEMLMQTVERCKTEGIPLTDNAHITWTRSPWGREDSTLAPPESHYPRVTCDNKTVDEHSWTNRVD